MATESGYLIDVAYAESAADECICGGEPPTVENFEPADHILESPRQAVSFDVFDDLGLRRVMVNFKFQDGREEVVHDGDAFTRFYSTRSTREAVDGGYHYSVSRGGGFPRGRIEVRVYPIDLGGNEPE